MKFSNKAALMALSLVFVTVIAPAQVGIGTDKPEGMLDLRNSNGSGFVYPKAALTSTLIAAPVVNPNGGNLVAGTVVFNTNTTYTGSNDVSPGIYAWDGSEWNPQYLREDSAIFEQSTMDFRTVAGDLTYNSGTSDWAEIPGLGTGSSFTPKYTGTYKIKTRFNFGGGKVVVPGTGIIMMATTEGLFRLTFNGTPYLIYTHSYSLYNNGVYQEQFIHDSALTQYVNLTAGVTYNFKLEIDIFVATHYENGGNSGDGRGHVGINVPCSVEFTYVNE